MSIAVCLFMITSISAPFTQNAGQPQNVSQSQNVVQSSPSPTSVGSRGLADSPWPMFRQNLQHTGLSPYLTSSNPGLLKWKIDIGTHVESSPIIGSDGTIYVGAHSKKLHAINPDGTEKWGFATGEDVYSSPAIGYDGTIYVGSRDNKLYAINKDGTEKWNFTTGHDVLSSPAIGSDGTIYVGSHDDNFYSIDNDGTEKWAIEFEGIVHASPAIDNNGIIYITGGHERMACYPDGSEKWSFPIFPAGGSSPAIYSNGMSYYGGGNDFKLHAINPDGTEMWSFTTGEMVYSSPAVDIGGTIYVGSHDNNLYAINPDGSLKWSFETRGWIESSPAIGRDGTIYVGSFDNYIYAIHPDGKEKWRFLTGGPVHSSPAIDSDGTIYIGSNDGYLYAIGKPNAPPNADAGPDQSVYEGNVVWFDGSPSYDPDGTIEFYEWDFGSSNGLWWNTGTPPDTTSPTPTHIYGDDGVYIATLRVTDNQGLSDTDTCSVTVLNVDPTVTIESAIMDVEIGLRVAGRKYNDVGMTLYEDNTSIGYVSIERMPGSPDDQMMWIPVSIDFSKSYSVIVTYTLEDPPNIGGNPVWIYIKSQNGSIKKIHHTFNVQQSKKRDSDHWNHVEPWEVDLSSYFIGLQFEITSRITDPGSDDETLTFTYGSQVKAVIYLNNPPNPDPYPSPEVNPVDITHTTNLIYKGPGTVMLMVEDDDNVRLDVGEGSDSYDIQ